MEITHHGFVFNTDNMTAFATGAPATPTIYMNENGLAFLQISRDFWPIPRMRHISRIETKRLSVLYGVNGILEILNCRARSKCQDREAIGAV